MKTYCPFNNDNACEMMNPFTAWLLHTNRRTWQRVHDHPSVGWVVSYHAEWGPKLASLYAWWLLERGP